MNSPEIASERTMSIILRDRNAKLYIDMLNGCNRVAKSWEKNKLVDTIFGCTLTAQRDINLTRTEYSPVNF